MQKIIKIKVYFELLIQMFETVDFNMIKVEEFKSVWDEFKQWFKEKEELQANRPLYKDPVYKTSEVRFYYLFYK